MKTIFDCSERRRQISPNSARRDISPRRRGYFSSGGDMEMRRPGIRRQSLAQFLRFFGWRVSYFNSQASSFRASFRVINIYFSTTLIRLAALDILPYQDVKLLAARDEPPP